MKATVRGPQEAVGGHYRGVTVDSWGPIDCLHLTYPGLTKVFYLV